MQNRVLVVGKNGKQLMLCHPARARELLDKGRAIVYRREPFTIQILDRTQEESGLQPTRLKIDPGSKTTGLALVVFGQNGQKVVWAAELEHRGNQIKRKMIKRSQWRRSRRHRKCRFRPPRFNNRKRPEGWLPPSLQSRVDNVETWVKRLRGWAPITALSMELAKFDTQKMQSPDIMGVKYQRGTLFEANIWEYLLEKWGRKCAYCGAENIPLEKEHIIPRSRGGSNRASNLCPSCKECNRKKGNQTAEEFGYPRIQAEAKKPLKEAAVMNATRWKVFGVLKATGVSLEVGTGARTKYNRQQQSYPKAHWIDAACIGRLGDNVYLHPDMQPLKIKAAGRGSRQMCLMDRYGFPRTKPKRFKEVHGFRTGDLVRAVVPDHLKAMGIHIGRVAIRSSGTFRVGEVDGINWKYCSPIQRNDGYKYARGGSANSSHG